MSFNFSICNLCRNHCGPGYFCLIWANLNEDGTLGQAVLPVVYRTAEDDRICSQTDENTNLPFVSCVIMSNLAYLKISFPVCKVEKGIIWLFLWWIFKRVYKIKYLSYRIKRFKRIIFPLVKLASYQYKTFITRKRSVRPLLKKINLEGPHTE